MAKAPEKAGEKQEKQVQTCFVMMPFSDPPPYAKGHFDRVYKDVLQPAIEKAGFAPHRTDEDLSSTSAMAKVIRNIVSAPIAVCDLSARNPNVLYELGIRHAFDMPVLLVKDERTPHLFDLNDTFTITYRQERRYDEVLEDHTKIANALRATLEDQRRFSMVREVRIQEARANSLTLEGEDPNALALRGVMQDIAALRSQMDQLARRLPGAETREQTRTEWLIEREPLERLRRDIMFMLRNAREDEADVIRDQIREDLLPRYRAEYEAARAACALSRRRTDALKESNARFVNYLADNKIYFTPGSPAP